MTNSPSILTRTVLTLAVAGSMAAVLSAPAAAQTARNLICNGCVDTRDIKTSAVKTNKIKNNAVTSAKIRNSAVGNAKIRNNAVTSGKIADGSVGNADLGNNAVTGGKIADGTVDTPDLAGNAVTSGKIANGAVGNADLANDAVDSSKVAPNSLTAGDLAPSSVGSSEVANNSLTSSDLGSSSVGASEVASNSIFGTDLRNEAGADFAGGNQSLSLSATDVTVRFVSITAPTSGFVIVNASAYFFSNVNGTGRCSITTGTTIDLSNLSLGEVEGAADNFEPLGMTRGFTVGSGTTTFRLVCDESSGSVQIIDSQITAMYFPTRY